MMILFILSTICDISFYLLFAHVLTSGLLEGGLNTLVPLIIICVAAGGACRLHGLHPKLRFVPLLLLPACFYWAHSLAAAVIIALPCLYVALTVFFKRFFYQAEGLRAKTRFCAIAAFMPLIAIPFNGYAYLISSFYFQYLFICICCAICILRLSRIDKTAFELRFILINLGPVIGGFALVAVLSFTRALAVIWQGLGLIITHVIWPMGRFIISVMDWLESKIKYSSAYPGAGEISRIRGPGFTPMEITPDAAPLNLILQWLLVAVLVALAIYVGKKFMVRARQNSSTSEAFVTRVPVLATPKEPPAAAKQSFFTPRNPRLAVRHHYRQFLRICAERGSAPEKGDTSKDINAKNNNNFSAQSIARLRELYIKARYSEHVVESHESKEAGELVKHL